MRLDLFCKQISLTLIISDRNGSEYREKKIMFQWKTIVYLGDIRF